ncbi:tetratricopeptide repeat protein [Pseudodesulfovibrio sp.]|uniref:tetratricopeptide repeat protein n=1 Tax=Pseudodesulfovibrio sp. TaxID=2035812 RepID=UPI002638378F|nr:tetratricopeptide repeat protein [Pseudodesulfovibrio sp.]MDD3311366.1 tetratricopeptide repeat protein [Pseudodesulfovibrio sp.]
MHQLKKIGLLNREGMAALNDGRMDDALNRLLEADRIAREQQQPLHEAKVQNNLGLVHQAAGRYPEAESCFRQAVRIAVERAGSGNILHRTIARNLARLDEARDHGGCCGNHACENHCACGGSCRA